MKTSVVVLHFNSNKDTFECLESLEKVRVPIEITIIDNGSTEESINEIEKKFTKVKIIRNKKNLGFAGGNNVGIRYALRNQSDNILLLNNDTVISLGAIENLLKNSADIVGAVLEFKRDKKIIYDLGGHISWWFGRANHEEVKSRNQISSRNPDYVSGAAMLVRRKVFEKIGLFDERYFLYYEDADFCTRAKREGFTIVLEPNSIIFHKLGASTGRYSLTTLYHNLRSNLIFINKNLSLWQKPVAWIYWSLLILKVITNRLLVK